jgi:hypothetical protein
MRTTSKSFHTGPRRSGLALGLLTALVSLPTLAGFAAPKAPPKKPAPSRTPNTEHPTPTPQASIRYNRDIRPILSDNCFACHGPDKNKRMAGLRLDLRDDAVTHKAIVPGKPEQSAVIARVFATNPDELMPPVESHKTLTPEQKSLLRRWVAEGAQYEPHWAYIPPKRPEVPKLTDRRYPVLNPVDAFIRQKLLSKSIIPSPEADRRTLLRRVYLDLIGIPPTPDEVEAFLADTSPKAYEKVVDQLLKSPHYGERMATPWLDVVRYADTVGFHGDQNQNAWPYRDYVVDSFNQNKPFDRFTREQLAGDLLVQEELKKRGLTTPINSVTQLPTDLQPVMAATAFNRLNMVTREGGAQAKEYLAKYSADRVRTVSMTWLGSTFACAECHDHKYDPISAKDFYSIAAFFSDVKQWGVYADYNYTPNPDLRGYNNDFPFPPETRVRSPYLQARMDWNREVIRKEAVSHWAALAAGASPGVPAYEAWCKASLEFLGKHAEGWETPKPEVEVSPTGIKPVRRGAKAQPVKAADSKIAAHRVEADGRVVLTDALPADVEVELRPEAQWVAALKVEALPAPEHGGSVFRKGMEAALMTATAYVRRTDGKAEAMPFRHAGANFSDPRYRNGQEIIGVHGGWKLSAAHRTEPHVSVWLPATPVRLAPGETITITFPNLPAASVRVATSPFAAENPNSPAMPAGLAAALAKPQEAPKPYVAQVAYLFSTAWNAEAFGRVKKVEADLLACRDGLTPVLVTEAWQPVTTRVLPRGNWQDESGPVVTAAVPHFLPGYDPNPSQPLSRLDLANWLVAKENPLTARVFVNRVWKQFFGNGLSAQVEDLGAQGEWPTHPELLDWLAVEFRDGPAAAGQAWDVKHLVRLLVTSATYRQSSNLRKELLESDPGNRMLASQNPRRLEAEFVRDNALAIAEMLVRDVGGPPVKPYQPEGYYANIQFPDRPYVPEADDRQWRRGLYVHWQRTFLHPMLVNFDAPSREDCIAARNVANTPQQALTLLNDPEFVEAARVFAGSLLIRKAETDAQRLDRAYLRALGRPARPKERQSMLAFLAKVRAEYQQRPEDAKKLTSVGIFPAPQGVDPVDLAAWSMVCRVVLNLQETITRY